MIGDDPTVPEEAELQRVIQEFVRQQLLDEPYDGPDPLAELHFDSLSLEQLLGYLEETYKLLFDPEDSARVNLASSPTAAAMVQRRLVRVRAGEIRW